MKAFIYLQTLKFRLRILRIRYVLSTIRRNAFGFFSFLFDFASSTNKFFAGLNNSYKLVMICMIGVIIFGGGFFVAKSYSQDFSGQQNQQASYEQAYSTNYTQNQFVQLLQLGNQIIRGSSSGLTNGTTSSNFNLMSFVSNLDAYVYENNPVSLVKYGSYYAQSHSLVKSSYAQSTAGTGYSVLSPIIPLWEIARNISYLLIAVMIVVVGFIIILGGKYGQTEFTIISSLPKILIALLLITFSYPIAGLAIDISNLGTNLIVNILGPQFVQKDHFFPGQYPVGCGSTVTVPSDYNQLQGIQQNTGQQVTACDYFANNKQVASNVGGDFNVFRLMSPIVNYQDWDPTKHGADSILSLIQTPTDIGFLDAFLLGIPFNLGSEATILVVTIIMNILMLYWAIKIFILILTAFIRIVMQAMMGPFLLVSYPLSGNAALVNYLRGLISPALVFPAVFGMLFIAAILAYGTSCVNPTDGSNIPCSNPDRFGAGPWYISQDPSTTIQNFNSGPLLFVDTVNPNFIWNFVAVGLVIAIPGIGKHLDDALKAETSRHFEQQGSEAGKRAMAFASRIPLVGGLVKNVF